MNTKSACLIVSLTLTTAVLASAADKISKEAKPTPKQKPALQHKLTGTETTIETGTNIKQKVHRYGLITDGTSEVLVIDSDAIRRSGANSIAQALRSNIGR